MKKTILTIILCGVALVGITGCGEKKNDEHSFVGKIIEVNKTSIIVCPNENENERKSADRFEINLLDDTTYEVDTIVKITYVGGIEETYPAKIETTKIEIDVNKETKQNYSKTIEDVTIEMNIPNEWKYEELPKNENNDFYKYALKLYKSEENKQAILYFYNNQFGACGTGRTTKNITLDNEKQAIIGYYGSKEWNDIYFYELNPNLAMMNNGLEGDEAEEVLDFVKTINIK